MWDFPDELQPRGVAIKFSCMVEREGKQNNRQEKSGREKPGRQRGRGEGAGDAVSRSQKRTIKNP